MSAIDQETVQVGDQVKIRGGGGWVPVLDVHDAGVHVVSNSSHHWHRWQRVSKHKAAS